MYNRGRHYCLGECFSYPEHCGKRGRDSEQIVVLPVLLLRIGREQGFERRLSYKYESTYGSTHQAVNNGFPRVQV